MVREGLDLATVARRMGHSVTMTAQRYTHVIESCDGNPRRRWLTWWPTPHRVRSAAGTNPARRRVLTCERVTNA